MVVGGLRFAGGSLSTPRRLEADRLEGMTIVCLCRIYEARALERSCVWRVSRASRTRLQPA